MSAITFRADEWDRLTHMPVPEAVFHMTCDEGHDVQVSHFRWHALDTVPCTATVIEDLDDIDGRRCPGRVDLAHARRHVDCPCDEV